jgi:hypothetical protein
VATVVVAQKQSFGEPRSIGQEDPAHIGPPSLLAEGWPSGPRRQGFAVAAQNAPLTAPGRSANGSARREGECYEGQLQQQKHPVVKVLLDIDRNSHGRRSHNCAPFVRQTGEGKAQTCAIALFRQLTRRALTRGDQLLPHQFAGVFPFRTSCACWWVHSTALAFPF